jgi:hypothetical protein
MIINGYSLWTRSHTITRSGHHAMSSMDFRSLELVTSLAKNKQKK